MRGLLLVVVLLLAGCTSFPSNTREIGAWDVPALGPGENVTRTVAVGAADALLVGFRIGPEDRVLIGLEAPNGTRFSAYAGTPPGLCVVMHPAPGTWTLLVAADAWDGRLTGGRFTVRTGSGAPPAMAACVDDGWPGRGNDVTLLLANVTLGPGENRTFEIDVSQAYASLSAGVRGTDAANVTLDLVGPGSANGTSPSDPAIGAWRLTAHAPSNATLPQSVEVAVRARGR